MAEVGDRQVLGSGEEAGEYRGLLEEALIAAVTRAVMYLRSAYVGRELVGLGRGGDVSREFDVVAEEVIARTLRAYLGGVRLVAEERGSVGDGPWLAVVDPVDGSLNFEAGIPVASVSIGIARNTERASIGDIEAAVVAEVFRDAIYLYDRRGGFKAIGVDARRRERPSGILLGYFETAESFEPYLRLAKIAGSRPRLRSLGSASLDIVYVSLGIAMGFVDARAKLRNVDVAPSIAIASGLGAGAYLCDGTSARSVTIRDVTRVECLVVGYDEETARLLLRAVTA